MTHSSSELPKEPVRITHMTCGGAWDLYAIEWPPQVVVCTGCGTAMRIATHDPASQRVTFRQA